MKLFKSERCCLNNNVIPAAILVDDLGKIIKIYTENSVVDYYKYPNVQVIDVGASVLMAGIVDSHVHVNEPGRTDWEGYVTATKAAAAGGITTIVDMPLNSIPPTTTLENLHIKQKTAQGQIYVDVGFWGGFISGNEGELLKMVEAGVVGFKCFMCPSGVDEFPCVNKDEIKRAAQILEKTDVVLAFHAEVEGDFDSQGDDPKKYHHFLKTRPDTFEIEAIKTVVDICSKHNLKCHIVHLSTAKALPLIETAKLSGCKLTVETCHHYLSLFSEDIQDGATQFKCCPPIRDDNNRTELWKAVQAKQIDMIVSDHSPCTPNLKCLDTGDFIKAWGGISSLQFGLSLFWTEARNRGFNFWDITKLMSISPASLCGLSDLKGQIKEGLDADFVIWDPEAEIEISAENIFHKNKVSPYIEKKLYGKVLQTIVRGQTVYKDGMHCSNLTGILLKRK